MAHPLDSLDFPVVCVYPGCLDGPFTTAEQVGEHVADEHLPESIWTFATENMVNVTLPKGTQ